MSMNSDKTREPCGNKDCDLCYPLPRWKVERVVIFRREYFGEVKAPTIENARVEAERGSWTSSYSQTPIEEQPAVIEPLDQESIEWHQKYGADFCFHAVRARNAAQSERFPRPVICEWCGNRFRAIFDHAPEKQTQGDDCASSVYQNDGEWYVAGGYGSGSFDMSRLRFIANHPAAPLDPVCDQCINERVAVGDLVKESEE